MPSHARICVLLPTFNNAQTLPRIVEYSKQYVTDVVVINDGCTDETAAVLKSIDDVAVVVHETNLGKGAAIKSGFEYARKHGYTHAITMDTDGQHDPAELPLFVNTVEEHPESLIIGMRNLEGAGRAKKSRVLRANSNFWTWVQTGQKVSDTQSGFRCYPINAVADLHYKKARYDFEIEVLIFALWNDVNVHSVPVRAYYGPGSESHFRPIVDFLRVTRLNIHLIFERLLLSKGVRQKIHRASFRQGTFRQRWGRFVRTTIIQESVTPIQFATCVGIGVFCGILPIWGFQGAAAIALAGAFKLSRTLAFLASNISIPILMPFILYFSLYTGQFLMYGNNDLLLSLTDLPEGWQRTYALQYIFGSIGFSFIAGLLSTLIAFVLVRTVNLENSEEVPS